MLAAVDSFQLTEEAIVFPILPPSLAVLGLLVILVDVLKLLLAFLSVPAVPQLSKLPEKIIINKAGRQAVQSVFSGTQLNHQSTPLNADPTTVQCPGWQHILFMTSIE